MSDNNIDDFSIFATSKRVKKEEPTAYKSPLDTGTKWTAQEEVQAEVRIERRPEVRVEAQRPTPQESVSKPSINTSEEVGNVGSELQKFRKYPTKTYDKFLNKMVTFNEEEFY